MKYILWILQVIICCMLAISCKKETDKKTCWTLVDPLGNFMNEVCGKSENEMNAEYGGRYFFFRSSDTRYCWKLRRQPDPEKYVRKLPQFIINQFFPTYTAEIVDCNSFCKWRVLYKRRSKITGNYGPVIQRTETIMNISDTCGRLFVGRIVTVSETADSIHTAEFAENIDQY
ncbi:MAG: hypothetical protein IPL50_05365 [Chitinophagaceae bacterium]|nr:hypothetical protein [Chitinophagaceae bacterium]